MPRKGCNVIFILFIKCSHLLNINGHFKIGKRRNTIVLTNLKFLYQKTCEKDEENMRKWISVQQDSETSLYEIVQKTPII